jgi:hypothetical protein
MYEARNIEWLIENKERKVQTFLDNRFVLQDLESGVYFANKNEMKELLMEFMDSVIATLKDEWP